MDGQTGNDRIAAAIGVDTVYSGAGNGAIFGYDTAGTAATDRADPIYAGIGDDSVVGGVGNDTVTGGLGGDAISAGAGNDTIYGDDAAGTNSLGGAASIDGGAGDDSIRGGAGADTIHGGDGNYLAYGDAGDDHLEGGEGSDLVSGGDGNDQIIGGALGADDNIADTLTGGLGNDTFTAGNRDRITDFNAGNTGSITDGVRGNNDFVDLTGYYNAANLATINQARVAAGLKPYVTSLGWLRADQADGVLNDISTANGFAAPFTMTILSGAQATAPTQLTYDNTGVACFVAGTLIDTARGPVPIETLGPGDLVMTRGTGLQPIRWIGSTRLAGAQLADNLKPVRIRRHALGTNVPSSDLMVSPQHRVLVRSRIAHRMFGAPEVLVAAKQLCQLDGVDVADDLAEVDYFHMLFGQHEVVMSNGAETESMFTGPEALRSIGAAARQEIFTLFPELQDHDYRPAGAREFASGRMGRRLVVRHIQNGKPRVEELSLII